MKKDISRKLLLPQPINKVWSALSDSQELSEWFLNSTIELKEAGKVLFEGKGGRPGLKIKGEILTVQVPINLAYSWEDPGLRYTTYVWWKLLEKGESTFIELDHSGFKGIAGLIASFRYNKFWKRKFEALRSHMTKQPA